MFCCSKNGNVNNLNFEIQVKTVKKKNQAKITSSIAEWTRFDDSVLRFKSKDELTNAPPPPSHRGKISLPWDEYLTRWPVGPLSFLL